MADPPYPADLPTRCQQCSVSHGQPVHRHCELCESIAFSEIALCDLNRSVQANDETFTCHAFRPRLTLYTKHGHRERPPSRRERILSQHAQALKRQAATRTAYKKALAVQRAKHNPEDVIVELKYHTVWNVAQRQSLLGARDEYADQVKESLAAAEISSVTFAALLWLAPDHIHVYFESDSGASPEAVVKAFKDVSSSILRQHSTIGAQLSQGQAVWDEAYFCETVG